MAEEHRGSPSDAERDGRIRLHVEGQVTLATLTRLVDSWRDFLGEVAHVESVLSPEVRTIGTIEGELEGLIIHGTKRFLLYDRLTGRQVICYFGNAISWEQLRDVFGKRMAVTGEIRSRRSGDRAFIDVSSYYVFPPENELPSAREVRGLLRDGEPPLIIGKPNMGSALPLFEDDEGAGL